MTDGPFAETKDLVAGWMIIDVDSLERAQEAAAFLSSAPGPGGRPLQEWIEVRPFLSAAPTGHGNHPRPTSVTLAPSPTR